MEDFVTYKQAVKLKELGFNWKCDHYYQKENNPTIIDAIGDGSFKHISCFWQDFNAEDKSFNRHNQLLNPYCSAPTLAQAAKWLREVKGVEVIAFWDYKCKVWFSYYGKMDDWDITHNTFEPSYSTYEAALSAILDEVLKLIENKQL